MHLQPNGCGTTTTLPLLRSHSSLANEKRRGQASLGRALLYERRGSELPCVRARSVGVEMRSVIGSVSVFSVYTVLCVCPLVSAWVRVSPIFVIYSILWSRDRDRCWQCDSHTSEDRRVVHIQTPDAWFIQGKYFGLVITWIHITESCVRICVFLLNALRGTPLIRYRIIDKLTERHVYLRWKIFACSYRFSLKKKKQIR